MNRQGNGLSVAARQGLIAASGRIDGSVKELAFEFGTAQPALQNKMTQRLLYFGVQGIGEFIRIAAVGRGKDESLCGGQKRPMAGKPDCIVRPQSTFAKAGEFGKRIKAATMRIAGEVTELPQFAEHGEIRLSAEHAFEIRQVGDLVPEEVSAQRRRGERYRAHNVIVPTRYFFMCEL